MVEVERSQPLLQQMPRKKYAPNEDGEAVLQMCSRDDEDHRTNACCQQEINIPTLRQMKHELQI